MKSYKYWPDNMIIAMGIILLRILDYLKYPKLQLLAGHGGRFSLTK
jgi:hypothetical protein